MSLYIKPIKPIFSIVSKRPFKALEVRELLLTEKLLIHNKNEGFR